VPGACGSSKRAGEISGRRWLMPTKTLSKAGRRGPPKEWLPIWGADDLRTTQGGYGPFEFLRGRTSGPDWRGTGPQGGGGVRHQAHSWGRPGASARGDERTQYHGLGEKHPNRRTRGGRGYPGALDTPPLIAASTVFVYGRKPYAGAAGAAPPQGGTRGGQRPLRVGGAHGEIGGPAKKNQMCFPKTHQRGYRLGATIVAGTPGAWRCERTAPGFFVGAFRGEHGGAAARGPNSGHQGWVKIKNQGMNKRFLG